MKNVIKQLAIIMMMSSSLLAASNLSAATSALTVKPQLPAWHKATVMGSFALPDRKEFIEDTLDPNTGHEPLPIRYWPTSKATIKGLLLIVPGTGSNADSSHAQIMASVANDQGHDAIIVANPFSPDFQKSFSPDHLVGFPQNDTAGFVEMMESAYAKYLTYKSKPRVVNITGFSLGGAYAVRASALNFSFKVKNYIAVNPPVDLGFAINAIDNMIRTRLNSTIFPIPKVIRHYILPLANYAYAFDNKLNLLTLQNYLGLISNNENINKGIIGASFQLSIGKITRGLFRNQDFKEDHTWNWLISRVPSITFANYMGVAGIAIQNENTSGKTFQELMDEVDLRRQIVNSKRKKNIFIIHSRDDFLLDKGDLKDLDQLIGPRLKVLSSGGHGGAIWTRTFADVFKHLL